MTTTTATAPKAPSGLGDGSLGVVVVEPGEAIQIRSLNAISGDVAFLGIPNENGIRMAVEDYGQIHGHDVDVGMGMDDLCSADGGQAAAQTIVADQDVVGVIGTSCSGAATAASPLISEAGMVMISGSNTSPALTSDLAGTAGPNYHAGYFRTAHNDLYQGQAAANFALEVLGMSSAAAIHDGDPYTEGLARAFADAFEAGGGTLTGFTAVNKGDTDMVPVLTEVAAGGPELLFFPIFQPEGDFIIQQSATVAGLENTVMMAADGLLNSNYLALAETEGMFFSGPDVRYGENFNQSTGESAADVLADYEAEFGEAPAAPFWAHSYDAAVLLMDAIVAASTDDAGTLTIDRAGVREYLHGVSNYSGLIGTMSCDAYGDCSSAKITVIQNIDSTDYAASTANVVYEYAPLAGGKAAGEVTAPEGACIGLVTDVGEVDDKSFNQAAWTGVETAGAQFGADVDYVETQAAKDYATNIGLFADSGCDIIVTVGFALGEATAVAAAEYPDVDFIGVDQFQGEPVDGVAGLIFPEDQSGFLAGALAASLSTSGTIAAVLGTDIIPPVVAFGEGYLNGARWVNPDIEVIKTYHPGGLDVAFTDPEWGATTARQALDQGADVVFGAGGKTGNGAIIEVAGEPGAFCIGVDVDQWGSVPEAQPCLVSSAMKSIAEGVVHLIGESLRGNMPSGNYVGSADLAPFHAHADSVPDSVKDMLVQLKADLEAGVVPTCVWVTDAPGCPDAAPVYPDEIAYDFGVTEDTIRVGALADLSGVFAGLVIQIVDAQSAYWDKVNAEGGIGGKMVEFVVEDNAYDVTTHLEKYELMRDEDNGVVTLSQSTGSPHTAAIAEMLVEDGLSAIPLSWYSGWPDPAFGQNVFESYSNYCYESINGIDFLNEYMQTEMGIANPTLGLVTFPGEYGQDGAAGVKIAAEALGIEIVYDGEATFIPGADQTPVISGLAESGADMVWTTVTPSGMAELVGGAAAVGYLPMWSGNVPSFDYRLLGTAVGPILDTNFIVSTYTATWNSDGIPGLDEMKAWMLGHSPDLPVSDAYIVGWTEAMAAHAALDQAARNGDMTRQGVIDAYNQVTVDYKGLAPNQSWGGDLDDVVVRESFMYDVVLDEYDDGATIAEGGGTGTVLLRGPFVSDITLAQEYTGACFAAAG